MVSPLDKNNLSQTIVYMAVKCNSQWQTWFIFVSVYPSFPFPFLRTFTASHFLLSISTQWVWEWVRESCVIPSPPFSSVLSQTTRNIWTENREFRTHPSPPWMSPTMLGSDCALGVWTPHCYPTKPCASVAFLSWLCWFLRRMCGWILLSSACCVVQSV